MVSPSPWSGSHSAHHSAISLASATSAAPSASQYTARMAPRASSSWVILRLRLASQPEVANSSAAASQCLVSGLTGAGGPYAPHVDPLWGGSGVAYPPLALLTNSHFAELLDMLSRMADYVIVDAPPVGVVIDAAEIAKACDGTLIAVNYNDVSRQELLDVKQQIEQTGCPILGTVLNQVDYDNYMGRKYYKSYSKYGKYGYYRKYYKRSHEAEKK